VIVVVIVMNDLEPAKQSQQRSGKLFMIIKAASENAIDSICCHLN
jgi:hypothetical protein